MITFLYEQYGYYPSNINDGSFCIDNWMFKLVEVECDEHYLEEIEKYCVVIRNNFYNNGPYIIKTRGNKSVSYYDNKRYVLISIKKGQISVSDLNKFHVVFNQADSEIDLREVLKAWQIRNYEIESSGPSSLRIDSAFYCVNLEIVMFCLGLCHNAMQYLSDIINYYGKSLSHLTITQKRIHDLSNLNFYNPFNYIIDHPIRDLVELYRNDIIDIQELIDLLEFYKIDEKLACLFIARLLYPVNVWDALEENIELKNKDFKLQYHVEKELQKIKNVYAFFKKKYNIRPINWLEL